MMRPPEPPQWGKYSGPAEFYRSPKWLRIVRASLKEHRENHRRAIARGDFEAIKFFEDQIAACRENLLEKGVSNDERLSKRSRHGKNRSRIRAHDAPARSSSLRSRDRAASRNR